MRGKDSRAQVAPASPHRVAFLVARTRALVAPSRVARHEPAGRKYWTFQVQKQLADGTWKALKTYKTLGSSEKRTVNLPKGTYRVWVNPKFGYQGVMSAGVTLKR